MHGFDYSIPQFVTRVWGIRMVITLDIVSKVLHIPRVEHPNYPGCDHFKTVSKNEFVSLFCETPSFWGDRQNTPSSAFAKGPRFLNMVMTFILHPLSYYNTITDPFACFLFSPIEDLSIDFPSHFILSLIDVYRDTATSDKLIFPWLSRSSFAIFLYPIPSLPTSHSCVPSRQLPFDKAQPSFNRGSPRQRRQLLQLLSLHRPPLLCLQRVE